MRDYALSLAQRYPIFPCRGDKTPLVDAWPHVATQDEEQISQWWGHFPAALIGVPTGYGWIVIDIDLRPGKNGYRTLARLEEELGELPVTFVVRTPSGGEHRYYLVSVEIRNSAGRLGPGIDVRGVGGYVCRGTGYRVESARGTQVALLPDAWQQRLAPPPMIVRPAEPADVDRTELDSALLAVSYTSDMGRDVWLRILTAYKAGGGDEEICHSWCMEQDDYTGPEDFKRDWDSRRVEGGVTAASVFFYARQAGWRGPREIEPRISSRQLAAGAFSAPAEAEPEPGLPNPPPELADFLEMQFPAREPVLGPLQTAMLLHLHAATGVGKSQFALGIAHAVCCGLERWNWRAVEPRAVMLIDGEMAGQDLQERLRGYDWTLQRRPFYPINAANWVSQFNVGHPNLATLFWQEQMTAWCEHADVIILDNVMSLVHVEGASMSSDEFWRAANVWSVDMRGRGKLVIWVDHENAEGKVFGTKTKTFHCDLVIQLERLGESASESPEIDYEAPCRFTVRFTKTRGRSGPEFVPFVTSIEQEEGGFLHWSYRPEVDVIEGQVIEMSDNSMSQREIATELGMSQSKVNRILKKHRMRAGFGDE